MENLKEIIKGYIRENYIKEEPGNGNDPNPADVKSAAEYLENIQDQRFIQSLARIDTLEEVQGLMLSMLAFLNKTTPAPELTKQTAIQAIQNAVSNNFISPDDSEKPEEPQPEPQPEEEEEVEEVSTSPGAGPYNTPKIRKKKYNFRLKKQKDK